MSLAVVRCPSCRSASRVGADAIGQMVGCPRCQMPFVAEEDIPVVQPVARPNPPRPSPPAAVAGEPPRRRRRPAEDEPEPEPQPPSPATEPHDPEHDPHARPVAGLPVSVLVGLALLPFGIPLLWRIAPFLTGQDSALSMAVPVSLAVAASALCLGVVYTIDWTAATRIKGVLMLVALAYLSAAGLYFLKKDLMDRVRAWGGDSVNWTVVTLQDGRCRAKMPGRVWSDNEQPLQGVVQMAEGRRARYTSDAQDGYDYLFSVGRGDANARRPDDAWFVRVREKLRGANGGEVIDEKPLEHQGSANAPGRQWTFRLAGDTVQIVQVFVVKERVYYLSAAGPKLARDDEFAENFFASFYVKLDVR